jgi:hypothetical protein
MQLSGAATEENDSYSPSFPSSSSAFSEDEHQDNAQSGLAHHFIRLVSSTFNV